MDGFTAGYVGAVEMANGVLSAQYFRNAQTARRHTDRFYDCWVPDGAEYFEDAE